MADSPSHKFGQELGILLEDLVLNYILRPRLQAQAERRNLYLDCQGSRPARNGKLVSWRDRYGNTHNLDFVIEVGGSDVNRGKPIAFIEAAWRRYTKHSKNKAQEIQGALAQIVELHSLSAPFCGVVLAGEFTEPSLDQLRRLNFTVLYIPYVKVVKAFKAVGLNIAFSEATADDDYRRSSRKISKLTKTDKLKLRTELLHLCEADTNIFMNKLQQVLDRHVTRVLIVPLFGAKFEYSVVGDALAALETLDLKTPIGNFSKMEVLIDYSNGDSIRAEFATVENLRAFLETLSP